MGKTKIEWATDVWNPIRGCSPVSPGCKNCYAAAVAKRFSGTGQPYEGLVRINAKGERTDDWNGRIRFVEEHLFDPMHWKRPRRIFVNSMSDLFHENLEDSIIDRIFAVMALSPQHIFQILTKRPKRMLAYFEGLQKIADQWLKKLTEQEPNKKHSFTPSDVLNLRWMHWRINQGPAFPYGPWPLPNVWLGVSAENQETANQRLPFLAKTPARVRFVSYEPALGPLDLTRWIEQVDLVICGGESGPHARRMDLEWARSMRDQCEKAKIAFFFKQWGEWWPNEQGNYECPESLRQLAYDEPGEEYSRIGKKAAGHLLDGKIYQQFPRQYEA